MKKGISTTILFLVIQSLHAQPTIEWQKTFGGSEYEIGRAVRQTSDGGYITCGYSLSTDGNVTGNHGLYDFWVVKFDQAGNMVWQNSFRGSDNDWGYDVQQTSNEGFILAGHTFSNDGDALDSTVI